MMESNHTLNSTFYKITAATKTQIEMLLKRDDTNKSRHRETVQARS